VLLPFKNLPELSMEYLRDFRELEIQQKILEVTLPLYEQAKVEEQKSIPTIMVLDKAVPPQIKNAPKRATITIVISLLIFFMLLPIIFRGEKALTRSAHNNSLEESEFKFFTKVKKIYKLKF
jgi:capsule polysaccharide export protein KpsE/RkpR